MKGSCPGSCPAPHREMETLTEAPNRDTVEREWEKIQEEQEMEVAPSETPEEAPCGLGEEAEDRPSGQTPLQKATAGPSRKGGRGPEKSPPRPRRRPAAGSEKGVKRLAKEKTTLPKAFTKEVLRISKSEGRDLARKARGMFKWYASKK